MTCRQLFFGGAAGAGVGAEAGAGAATGAGAVKLVATGVAGTMVEAGTVVVVVAAAPFIASLTREVR